MSYWLLIDSWGKLLSFNCVPTGEPIRFQTWVTETALVHLSGSQNKMNRQYRYIGFVGRE